MDVDLAHRQVCPFCRVWDSPTMTDDMVAAKTKSAVQVVWVTSPSHPARRTNNVSTTPDGAWSARRQRHQRPRREVSVDFNQGKMRLRCQPMR